MINSRVLSVFRLLVIVPVLFLFGCYEIWDSSLFRTESIYQLYTVRYSAADGRLSTSEEFHAKGKMNDTLRLTPPSEVRFRGEKLKPIDGLWVEYQGAWMGETLQPSYEWTWIDPDGKAWVNHTSLLPLSLKDGSLSQAMTMKQFTKKVRVRTSESDLSGDTDFVTVRVTQDSLNPSQPAQVQEVKASIKGSDELQFSAESATLHVGWAKVQLIRGQRSKLEQATAAGGEIRWYYESPIYQVELK